MFFDINVIFIIFILLFN